VGGTASPTFHYRPQGRVVRSACLSGWGRAGQSGWWGGATPSRGLHLSLSRLSHRLPGREAHPEGLQRTAAFHPQLADALLPQAAPVFDDATAFDPAVAMLAPPPALGECLIGPMLLPCQLLAPGFLGRPEDGPLGEREREAAQSLQQPAPRGHGSRRRVSTALIRAPAAKGVTQQEDREQAMDQQAIVSRVVFFLAALPRALCSRVLGADEAPCRPVMGTRGEGGATAGTATTGAGSSASGTTTVAAASETPSRCARGP
jgi:hypothetical protein